MTALPVHFEKTPTLTLAGKEYTMAGIAGLLAEEVGCIDLVRELTVARATAVGRERTVKRRNKPLLVAIEATVRGTYGDNAVVLAAFAMAPLREGKKSAAVKSAAAQKAKVTRETRKPKTKK